MYKGTVRVVLPAARIASLTCEGSLGLRSVIDAHLLYSLWRTHTDPLRAYAYNIVGRGGSRGGRTRRMPTLNLWKQSAAGHDAMQLQLYGDIFHSFRLRHGSPRHATSLCATRKISAYSYIFTHAAAPPPLSIFSGSAPESRTYNNKLTSTIWTEQWFTRHIWNIYSWN